MFSYLRLPNDFLKAQRNRNDFILVSSIQGAKPPRFERAGIAGIILVSLVSTVALNILPPVTATFLAAGAMILTKCCTMMEARNALDLSVLVTIASAFGLGLTVSSTQLDTWIAEQLFSVGIHSPFMALVSIYMLTFVLTELITSSAAAVLTVPIGIALAEQVGASPMPFIFAIMIAASSSFLTPIGYQTNLMVLNAGGYHPFDYTRLGFPLTLIVAIISLITIPDTLAIGLKRPTYFIQRPVVSNVSPVWMDPTLLLSQPFVLTGHQTEACPIKPDHSTNHTLENLCAMTLYCLSPQHKYFHRYSVCSSHWTVTNHKPRLPLYSLAEDLALTLAENTCLESHLGSKTDEKYGLHDERF